MARAEAIPLHDAERRVLGASHSEIGAYLLGLWGLPGAVVDAVAYQHMPDRANRSQFDALGALALAQALLDQCGQPTRGDVIVKNRLLQSLRAPFDWSEAQRRASRVSGDWHR